MAAVDIELSPADLTRLDSAAPRGATSGDRYPEHSMKMVRL